MGRPGAAGFNAGPALASERRLIDRLTRLRDRADGWYAVRIALSRVRAINLAPAVAALLLSPLRALTNRHDLEIFRLADHDTVALCRKVPVDEVQAALDEIHAMLRTDAGVCEPVEDPNRSFIVWYDLAESHQADRLLGWLDARVGGTPAPPPSIGFDTAATPLPPRPPTTADLEEIQRKLKGIRISDLIRQQIALEVVPGAPARPVFRETYVSIADLRDRLDLTVHPAANPWLFRYLTEILDPLMLRAVNASRFASTEVPISLNVNVSTIESGAFDRFEAAHLRAPDGIMLEIQFVDAIADMSAFLDARERLRAKGFGIIIDGMDPLAVPFVDLAGLAPDLLKLWWSDRIAGNRNAGTQRALREALSRFGMERVLLARVDSEDGIRWGNHLGIRRFQGRFIDAVLNTEERKPTVGSARKRSS